MSKDDAILRDHEASERWCKVGLGFLCLAIAALTVSLVAWSGPIADVAEAVAHMSTTVIAVTMWNSRERMAMAFRRAAGVLSRSHLH